MVTNSNSSSHRSVISLVTCVAISSCALPVVLGFNSAFGTSAFEFAPILAAFVLGILASKLCHFLSLTGLQTFLISLAFAVLLVLSVPVGLIMSFKVGESIGLVSPGSGAILGPATVVGLVLALVVAIQFRHRIHFRSYRLITLFAVLTFIGCIVAFGRFVVRRYNEYVIAERRATVVAGLLDLNGIYSEWHPRSGLTIRLFSNDDVARLQRIKGSLVAVGEICLYAQGTSFDDTAAKGLLEIPGLTSLHLDSTQITDKGLSWIAQCKSVRYLSVRDTEITKSGVMSVISSSRIEVLQISAKCLATSELAELSRTHGHVKIIQE
jgi:hypothetical protein